jgi:hypothetical protein
MAERTEIFVPNFDDLDNGELILGHIPTFEGVLQINATPAHVDEKQEIHLVKDRDHIEVVRTDRQPIQVMIRWMGDIGFDDHTKSTVFKEPVPKVSFERASRPGRWLVVDGSEEVRSVPGVTKFATIIGSFSLDKQFKARFPDAI